ncbi:MAG: type II toxin-antitoxin system death-on-curing family toxin [Thermoplasmata archaeon]
MKYLKYEELLFIHSAIIDATGGLHGVRDLGLLLSIIEKPKLKFLGKEIYRSVFQKATVYLESIAKYHPFVDGNKRTAIAAALRFLNLNSYNFDASDEEIENFILMVVEEKLDIDMIAKWLKKHSRKRKN